MGLLDDKDEFKWGDAAAGFSRAVAIDTLGAPVDGITWLLNQGYRLFGLPEVKNPIGGSEWIANLYRNYTPYKDNPGSIGDTVGQLAALGIPVLPKVNWGRVAKGIKDAAEASAASRQGVSYAIDPKDLDKIRKALHGIKSGSSNTVPKHIKLNNPLEVHQLKALAKHRPDSQLAQKGINDFSFSVQHTANSRLLKDGYSVEDVINQLSNATSPGSIVKQDWKGRVYLENPVPRNDGYGNNVNDMVTFDLSNFPKIMSPIPKGDKIKPHMLIKKGSKSNP